MHGRLRRAGVLGWFPGLRTTVERRKDNRRLVDGLGAFSLGLGAAQVVAPDAMNRLVGADDNTRNRIVQRWLGGARELAAGAGLESRVRPPVWLWTRIAGDVLDFGMLWVLLRTARRPVAARRRAAIAAVAVAGVTAADLVAAFRLGRRGGPHPAVGVEAAGRITVNRPAADVFAFWRDVESLPSFMAHLESVRDLGDGRTRWRATGPAGVVVEWDAEILGERAGEFIMWRSAAGAGVRNAGRVDFRPAPGGRGTEIRVHLSYDAPGGKLGAAVAKLFGESPDQQLRDDLRRFKQVLETGEVVRSEGSPEGTHARARLMQRPARPLDS